MYIYYRLDIIRLRKIADFKGGCGQFAKPV